MQKRAEAEVNGCKQAETLGTHYQGQAVLFGTYELNFRDEPADVRLGGDSLRAPCPS